MYAIRSYYGACPPGEELILDKSVEDFVREIVILTDSIRFKVVLANAVRKLVINSRDNGFVTECAVFPNDTTYLQRDTVPVKQWIEFIKRKRRRTCSARGEKSYNFV